MISWACRVTPIPCSTSNPTSCSPFISATGDRVRPGSLLPACRQAWRAPAEVARRDDEARFVVRARRGCPAPVARWEPGRCSSTSSPGRPSACGPRRRDRTDRPSAPCVRPTQRDTALPGSVSSVSGITAVHAVSPFFRRAARRIGRPTRNAVRENDTLRMLRRPFQDAVSRAQRDSARREPAT
jgi:hypothetical protein